MLFGKWNDVLMNCGHEEGMVAMGTEVDRNSKSIQNHRDDDFQKLEHDYKNLQEKTQELISERTHIESELRNLKKQAGRLEEEVRHLRAPPLIVGTLQDVLDPERAIVRSSNGTVFQVSLNQRIDPEFLKPGTRVALNQDSLSLVEVLHDAWDPIVSGSEMVEKPDVSYDMVAGLDDEILSVREAIELPLTKPKLFVKVGIKPPKGVLLVGPPGCGKTLLAKAVAHHTNATFIRMVGSELAQKYIGEGGRLVRELFSLAKDKSPSIIFLDEIDAIGAKRLDGSTSGDREVQRTLMQLLAELDGFDELEHVKIIAATNRPDILDDALLRPGRFDRIIEIPIPDEESRLSILDLHLKNMNTKGVRVKAVAKVTDGFSGAELKATCVEAGMIAIRSGRDTVVQSDVTKAVERINKKKSQSGSSSSPEGLYG
ncbi:MAG: proteasome-activating nucleotidase [Candidatus Thermoplasmatota archaeon]|nr:proteasome-activating nucleotidase [Candidatus Thermoplasmatota archaeon]